MFSREKLEDLYKQYDPEPFIEMTLRINDYLRQMFYIMGIDLVDFKVEYGYTAHGELLLADEISPDSMRLWKIGSDERFDKDLFRKDEVLEHWNY